jgi:ankyrin repeat protein
MLPVVGKRPLPEAEAPPSERGTNAADLAAKRQRVIGTGVQGGWGGIEWGVGIRNVSTHAPIWRLSAHPTTGKRAQAEPEESGAGHGTHDAGLTAKRVRTGGVGGWGGIEWGVGIRGGSAAWARRMHPGVPCRRIWCRRIWTPKQLLALREINSESLARYRVQASRGSTWWYCPGVLRGMPMPFKVMACRMHVCACQVSPDAWNVILNQMDAFAKYLEFRHLGLLACTNKKYMRKILADKTSACDPWRTCALAASDKRAEDMLRVTAKYGKTEYLRYLLAPLPSGFRFPTSPEEERTSLQVRNEAFLSAVEEGHNEAVVTLLAAGANVNTTHRTGEAPLQTAIRLQRADLVHSLLKANADVGNSLDYSSTAPLLRATSSRNSQIVDMLLQAGANVNIKDIKGETAVLKALENQDVDILRMLLNANADVAAMQNCTTPLHVAAFHGNPHLVEMLLTDRKNSRDLVNAGDHKNTRPLEDACEGCDCEEHPWVDKDRGRVVQILLDHGANARRAWDKASGEAWDDGRDWEEPTANRAKQMLRRVVYPLHEACKTNDEERVQRLLETAQSPGLDVNSRDFEGKTPLYLGCMSGNIKIVQMVRFSFTSLDFCFSVHPVFCSL